MMSMGFGLYITALGVGFVFISLFLVAILSKILNTVFQANEVKIKNFEDKSKIAAIAAVIATIDTDDEHVTVSTSEAGSHWRAAAKLDVMETI